MRNMILQLNDLKKDIIHYVLKSKLLDDDVLFDFDSDSYILTCIFKRKTNGYILTKKIDIDFHFSYSNVSTKKMAYNIVHSFDKFLSF